VLILDGLNELLNDEELTYELTYADVC